MKSSASSPHGSLGCLLHILEMLESTLKYQAYLYIGGNSYPTRYVLWMSLDMVVFIKTTKSSSAHVSNWFFPNTKSMNVNPQVMMERNQSWTWELSCNMVKTGKKWGYENPTLRKPNIFGNKISTIFKRKLGCVHWKQQVVIQATKPGQPTKRIVNLWWENFMPYCKAILFQTNVHIKLHLPYFCWISIWIVKEQVRAFSVSMFCGPSVIILIFQPTITYLWR